MTRVVVADRSPFVRMAVRSALTAAGIDVCAEAADAGTARRAIIELRPDVALLDAELDERLALVADLRAAVPEVALIVLSPDSSAARALAAVRAGACGFLPKSTPPERLPDIVLGAIAGEAAIPRRIVRRVLTLIADGTDVRRDSAHKPLTRREVEVLECSSRGLSDRSVGAELGVSEITVRRHLATASHKLGAARRDDAIAAFRRSVA
jgi:DNA-binding NarL/FixJ family response regulator